MSQSVTLKANPKQMQQMQQFYADDALPLVPYSQFRAKYNQTTITGYTSGKVLFQGPNAKSESQRWQITPEATATSRKQSRNELPAGFDQWAIIGSDEVGNGSYFGALTVCAVYLAPEQMALVKELGARDSKDLSDAQIRDLAWQLKATVPYHLTICDPIKYNEANQTRNANQIKVALHNFAIGTLVNKLNSKQKEELQGVLIDEFVAKETYLRHLQKESQPYTDRLYFAKRAEGIHLAVACASIIARDAFLESLERLGKPYGVTLPSGASYQSDQLASRLIKQYGVECLDELAKLHFNNTKKALKLAKL